MKRAPLKGKLVVITRSAPGGAAWGKYFSSLGANVYRFPTIRTVPIAADRTAIRILEHLHEFDWVVATSRKGLHALRGYPKGAVPLAVLGAETAKAARAMGYRTIFKPSIASGAALARELKLRKGASVLFLKSSIASRALPTILAARGAKITELPAYRTLPVTDPDGRFSRLLEKGSVDAIIFASPSAVRGFFARVDEKLFSKARRTPAVAIGPRTAAALKRHGFTRIRTAQEPTPKGIAAAMI